jgi:3-dehydroquinate dehydratase-1
VPATVTLQTSTGDLIVGAAPRIVGTVSALPVPANASAVCDIVEIRLDLLGPTTALPQIDSPILLTIRSKNEGGQWTGSEDDRLKIYRKWMSHVAAVDIELNSPIAGEVCQIARESGKASIVSFHDFRETPPLEVLQDLVQDGQQVGSIVKIVTLANEEPDVATLRALLEKRRAPLCVMGMGKHAARTRVEFPKLGSCLTYGYLDKPLAPGQTSAAELRAALV